MRAVRWPALVLVPGIMLLAAVYDAEERPEVELTAQEQLPASVSAVVTDRASSWFCTAGRGDEAHEVVVLNPTDEVVTGLVTVFGDAITGSAEDEPDRAYGRGIPPEPQAAPLEVAPGTRATIDLASLQPGVDHLAAIVEVDQGGVAVEHLVAGDAGSEAVPCASRGSGRWVEPWGSTLLEESEMTMLLFNPFPEDAVVDLVFATENGARESNDFRSVVVPGRRLVSAHIGSRITVAERVSVDITVRSGRIVAERHQTLATDDGGRGLVLGPAVADTALEWVIPGGWRDGRDTQLIVYNPNDERAEVDVEIIPDDPDDVVEPIPLSIPANQNTRIDLATTSVLDEVEAFSLVVRSVNEVPVAAQRVDRSTDGVPGLTSTVGTSVLATRWLSDLPVPAGGEPVRLVLTNPGFEAIATVELTLITADGREVLEPVEVGEGRRVEISLPDLEGAQAMLDITSTAPIAVEREIVGLTSRTGAVPVPYLDSVVAIPPPSF